MFYINKVMFQSSPLTEPILGEDHINAQFGIELGKDYKKIIMEDFTSLRVHTIEIFPNRNIVLNKNKKLRIIVEYTDTSRICFEFQEDYDQRKKEPNNKKSFLDCLFPGLKEIDDDDDRQSRLVLRVYVSQRFAEFVHVYKNSVKIVSQFGFIY